MRIIGSGGQDIEDTSSPAYTAQAKKLSETAEQNARLKKELKDQKSNAAENQEQQRSEITNLSAQQELLKLQLEQQQQAKLEQTNIERSHRFTSNADSVQGLINGEIIKISKTDASNLESAREKVSAILANLNSAPDSLSFSQMRSETIIPESFIKEKLALEGLNKNESLLLIKLILSINGIKYKENQDGELSDINSPKTNLFIPKANLNYKEAIVLNAGTEKADSYDALLTDPQLTEKQAEKLIRDLLQRQGIEFTERRNTAGLTEFHFTEPVITDISLREKTLINGVLGESITVPSTSQLQSMNATERIQSRNDLLKKLLPFGLLAGLLIPTGVVINNPGIIGLEKSTPTTRLLKEEREEINELKFKYSNDSRIENPTNTYIERDAGENVSQALLKVYPGYHQLERMYRQEIEQRILNKQNIANDTQAYPHGSDVISALPQYIKVPSIKDIYQQIKSLPANDDSRQGSSLTELYQTLTRTN